MPWSYVGIGSGFGMPFKGFGFSLQLGMVVGLALSFPHVLVWKLVVIGDKAAAGMKVLISFRSAILLRNMNTAQPPGVKC